MLLYLSLLFVVEIRKLALKSVFVFLVGVVFAILLRLVRVVLTLPLFRSVCGLRWIGRASQVQNVLEVLGLYLFFYLYLRNH